MIAKHPNIRVALNAASDDFRIIDHVIKALRRAGIPAEEIDFGDRAIGALGFFARSREITVRPKPTRVRSRFDDPIEPSTRRS
jgi:hypothetical protein